MRAHFTEVVQQMTGSLGITAALQLDGPVDSHIPGGIGEDLPHALRETLSNSARHSQASRAEMTVEAGSDLALCVHDNGAGIKTPPVAAGWPTSLAATRRHLHRQPGRRRRHRTALAGMRSGRASA